MFERHLGLSAQHSLISKDFFILFFKQYMSPLCLTRNPQDFLKSDTTIIYKFLGYPDMIRSKVSNKCRYLKHIKQGHKTYVEVFVIYRLCFQKGNQRYSADLTEKLKSTNNSPDYSRGESQKLADNLTYALKLCNEQFIIRYMTKQIYSRS